MPSSGSPAVVPLETSGPVTERPLTARSVVLSTLLGYHPPELPVRTLVRVGGLFGIAEATVRVALVRMVADGEVTGGSGVYRLAGHLLDRQRRQAESCSPRTRNARGRWRMAVVTVPPRPAAARTALRRAMDEARMAELREGVWLRPDNLRAAPPVEVGAQCTAFSTRPEDPYELATRLWDLAGWSRRAVTLLRALDGTERRRGRGTTLREEFLVSVRVLQHLRADPVLPDDLAPPDWPAADLRERYSTFEADFAARLRSYGDT